MHARSIIFFHSLLTHFIIKILFGKKKTSVKLKFSFIHLIRLQAPFKEPSFEYSEDPIDRCLNYLPSQNKESDPRLMMTIFDQNSFEEVFVFFLFGFLDGFRV